MITTVVVIVTVGYTVCMRLVQPYTAVPMLDGKIVGGWPASIENYPYQISLLYFGGHLCGGSIIAERWIVSAAHCTEGRLPSAFSIRAGSSVRNSGGVVVFVSAVDRYPYYNRITFDYDIVILKLDAQLSWGSGIGPIALPVQNAAVEVGMLAVATGWGSASESGPPSAQLQAVEVPIVSLADCRAGFEVGLITDHMLCSGFLGTGGKYACQGESGGPLASNGLLWGITSWGRGCGRPWSLGIHASVPALRSFIAQISGV